MFCSLWHICHAIHEVRTPLISKFFRRFLTVATICVSAACSGSAQVVLAERKPIEIFAGVRYIAEKVVAGAQGGGLVHFVQIDLSSPGIELFISPLDSQAVQSGWEYRLDYVSSVLRDQNLAVAVNASLFTSRSLGFLQLPGDLARSVETLVSDHVVNHLWEHTYLLAFDDSLRAWFTLSKPPPRAALERARWAVGGQAVDLREGRVQTGSAMPDARTAVALDQPGRHLFLAVGENISPRLLLTMLAERGGWTGMLLDGGHSTTFAVGPGAKGLRSGVLVGGWRPVATVLGVRARRLLHP